MRDLNAARLSAKEAIFRAHDEAENKFFAMLMVVIYICAIAIIAVFGFFAFGEDKYRQGQIDALSGKVYYELAKQADGSVIWTKKDTK
jgi:hypothetical protein